MEALQVSLLDEQADKGMEPWDTASYGSSRQDPFNKRNENHCSMPVTLLLVSYVPSLQLPEEGETPLQ